jgi:hypothetical protein
MRTKIKVLGIFIAFLMFQVIFTSQAKAQQSYVSLQVFYDDLSPYGQWVDYPNYGYVWIPDAGSDFVPYSTGGYWIMTDYGWTWASDYEWGWAPFHYGRWDYDNYYGWFWIPGNEWGPAWVTWRRAEGYYGWAPMGPGISISMSFGNNYNNYNNHWVFVNDRYFGRNDIHNYYADQNDRERIFRGSTVITNTYNDNRRQTKYIAGPDRKDVKQRTGRNVSSYSIKESTQPGQQVRDGQFRTYRPVVKTNTNQKQPSPARITNLHDVKQPSERNSSNLQNNGNRPVQQQNSVNQQNAIDKQNAVNQQNSLNQRNSSDKQNTVKQQNAINQQNALNHQKDVKNQFTLKQKEAVKRQNDINQQNAVKQQDAANQKNTVKRQNEVIQQNDLKNQNSKTQQNVNKTQSNRKAKQGNNSKTTTKTKTGESDKNIPQKQNNE